MTASILRNTYPREVVPVVRNNAGGRTHTVDLWNRLNRFLILGTEGGTYYVNEKNHVLDNVQVVKDALDTDPVRTIATIANVSESGRAPKNDYAIYALAVAASHERFGVRTIALHQLNTVCRTGTHLFQFIECVDKMRGWGSSLRKAVAQWYLSKDADSLAYQVLKYQQRNGWSHRDVFRKVHPVAANDALDVMFRFIANGVPGIEDTDYVPRIVRAYLMVQKYKNVEHTIEGIQTCSLSREMIPTEHLTDPQVLEALAFKMPYTALMRNLGNLTRHGVLRNTNVLNDVVRRLSSEEYIQKSRVHPISILLALKTYASGTGFRGDNTWVPEQRVVNALDGAFYKAFKNVQSTGKRFMVGVDVSGSMGVPINDSNLTSAEVAGALAMMIVRTEDWVKSYGFSNVLKPLNFNRDDSMAQILRKTSSMNYGGTNAGLLMEEAIRNQIPVDVFVCITDSETWMGDMPSKLLKQYRSVMGIDAKLVVLATESTQFSIADPTDPGMLDIAGFDSSVPEIMREFALGNV